MRSRKLFALIFSLLAIAPALAGYMTLLGAGVGSIQPAASWVSTTDPTFPSSSLSYSGPSLSTMFDSTGKLTYKPNNLALNTATLGTQSVTVQVGVNYLISFASGGGSIALSDAGAGTVTSASPVKITASTTTLTLTVTGTVTNAVVAAVTYETSPRTADQVITTSSAYYGPRIDYDPNTLAVNGLLIEEARTNLSIQSGDLTAAAWTKYQTTLSTDGTLFLNGSSAQKVTPAAGAGKTPQIYSTSAVTVTASTAYTDSWFVKAGGTNYVAITMSYAAGNYAAAVFDLSSQSNTAASQTSSLTATLSGTKQTYLGGGWFRISITSTSSPTSVLTWVAPALAATGQTFDTTGNLSGTFAGTETFYAAAPQLEPGPFATSYIPTAASSVTRAADVVQFTGAALTALQGSAGSVIVQSISEASSSPTAITNVIKGTNSILYRDTTGKTGTTNGTTALLTAAAPTWSSAIRNGLAWSASGRSLGYTSSAIATDANTVSNGGTLYLGSSAGSAVESGWYQSFGIWNQRLPDATLSTKLTVGGPYAATDSTNPFTPKFAANDNLPVHWRIAL